MVPFNRVPDHELFPPFVEASEPLSVALDSFNKTRFGFVPVSIDDRVVTSLSIRDILRVSAGKIVTPVENVFEVSLC